MSMITILPESAGASNGGYLAFLGNTQSVGRTAGEALDALTAKLDAAQRGSFILVQHFEPDHFFSSGQINRLQELMERGRIARDNNSELSPEEKEELTTLIDLELRAATARAEILARTDSR